jgi:hypothetical protein
MRIQTRKILLRAATAAAVACTAAVILLPAAVSAASLPAGRTAGVQERPTGASSLGNYDNDISSIRVR